MISRRIVPTVIPPCLIALLFLVLFRDGVMATAQQLTNHGDRQDSAKTTDLGNLAGQIKELQKQVKDLQGQVSKMQAPCIVAAGTATFKLGAVQDNATNARVKLNDDVAARLGDDYVVLLTNRFPTGGHPFFAPYWKRAKDGFDITLVDVSLGPDSMATYLYNKNKTYLIDWIVVKK